MSKVYADAISPWVQELLPYKNNMISLGVVQVENNSPLTAGSDHLKMPISSYLELGSLERITASTTLTPQTLSDKVEYATVVHRGDSFEEVEFNNILRGTNAIQQVSGQIAEVVARDIQTVFNSAIAGVFASATMPASKILDAQSELGGLDFDIIADASQQAFGEQMQLVDAIMVHSAVLNKLKQKGMVTYLPAANFSANILTNGTIPTIDGKRILVNDTICAATSGVYPSYLVKGQPFWLGYQRQLRIEQQRNILVGGGQDVVAFYVDYAPHIKGFSWDINTTNPTNASLADGTKWTLVADESAVGIAQILTILPS